MGCLIGEAAQRAGLSPRTIRFYERAGLLPPPDRLTQGRHHPGYRYYDDEQIRLVRLVAYLRTCGLSLKEMKELLRFVRAGCCGMKDQQYGAFLSRKLAQTESRIRKLNALKQSLRTALEHSIGNCACAGQEGLCSCVTEPFEDCVRKEKRSGTNSGRGENPGGRRGATRSRTTRWLDRAAG